MSTRLEDWSLRWNRNFFLWFAKLFSWSFSSSFYYNFIFCFHSRCSSFYHRWMKKVRFLPSSWFMLSNCSGRLYTVKNEREMIQCFNNCDQSVQKMFSSYVLSLLGVDLSQGMLDNISFMTVLFRKSWFFYWLSNDVWLLPKTFTNNLRSPMVNFW